MGIILSLRDDQVPDVFNLACRFEMLAFKSDVSHWRTKKEMVGVSVRYAA